MARLFGKQTEIRIPPQSTGPRILASIYQSVSLNNISGGGGLAVGYDIVGVTSGISGVIQKINGNDVLVLVDEESPVQEPVQGEQFLINGGQITASVLSVVPLYTNMSQVVDGNNPYNSQQISEEGSAFVRFTDGEQQLDAFGITRVTERKLLQSIKQTYAPNSETEEIVGGAGSTWSPIDGSLTIQTGTGSSDSIIRFGDIHYPYVTGVGREFIFTGLFGDLGKQNNVRRIGMFTEQDGVFFELNGTEFSVVLRSSASGSIVEERIPQNQWNGDVLDGSGGINNRSRVLLNITKVNIFWLDYAWLGAGRVRMGVYSPSGSRIVCHTFQNSNKGNTVYMRTGSLPYRQECFNTGVTSGPSSQKLFCMAVVDNNADTIPEYFDTNSYVRTGVPITTESPLFNIRTSTTFGPGNIINRIVSTGLTGSILSDGAPVVIRVYKNPTIGGTPSWSSITPFSPLQVDTSGTSSGGRLVASFMVGTNETDNTDLRFLKVHTLGDASSSVVYTVTAESLGGATNVSASFTWADNG